VPNELPPPPEDAIFRLLRAYDAAFAFLAQHKNDMFVAFSIESGNYFDHDATMASLRGFARRPGGFLSPAPKARRLLDAITAAEEALRPWTGAAERLWKDAVRRAPETLFG